MVGLIKTSERRQSIRSVRGGVERGSRIIKAGIYSLYHSGSRIIGSRIHSGLMLCQRVTVIRMYRRLMWLRCGS